MEIAKNLRLTAEGTLSLYKILIAGLLVYELVRYRINKSSGTTAPIDNAKRRTFGKN